MITEMSQAETVSYMESDEARELAEAGGRQDAHNVLLAMARNGHMKAGRDETGGVHWRITDAGYIYGSSLMQFAGTMTP